MRKSGEVKNLWQAKKAWSKEDQAMAFEQYKLYVQLADHISDRRDKANNFFLSLNTGVIAVVGFLWDKQASIRPKSLLLLPLVALLAFCYFWRRLVTSYRQLTTQKFILVGIVEERLPIKLWSTEWKMLGEGKDRKKYAPLSELEEWVPILFAVVYLGLAVIVWVWV